MKLIDIIKGELGVDAKDLEDELNLKTVKEMQSNLDEIADELIAEEIKTQIKEEDAERKAFADRLAIARTKKHNIAKARKKAEQLKGYSPGRLALLKRLGKVD